ncbi:hypothetical protein E2P81_ATG06954 [Venturia nashicola]|uniref:Uncharacterized protein n=1 Tax=Venturia nashicola TaxID=86259 RepID=A0A4Z1P138_9PEZI|nr:hypothetical protein E6O75_ATG07124 [Venturia nashicola]TLD30301.1 hypothetical protein E2P81_ATG06954 [Venturia nashicola]
MIDVTVPDLPEWLSTGGNLPANCEAMFLLGALRRDNPIVSSCDVVPVLSTAEPFMWGGGKRRASLRVGDDERVCGGADDEMRRMNSIAEQREVTDSYRAMEVGGVSSNGGRECIKQWRSRVYRAMEVASVSSNGGRECIEQWRSGVVLKCTQEKPSLQRVATADGSQKPMQKRGPIGAIRVKT